MKKLASCLISCLLVVLSLHAIPVSAPDSDIQVDTIHDNDYFIVGYDSSIKQPRWVQYVLTKEMVILAERSSGTRASSFYRCALCGTGTTDDYTNSGYSRGHMAMAEHFGQDSNTTRRTHYMCNVCPQRQTMNVGNWLRVEKQMSEYAKTYGQILRVCGPIYYNNGKPTSFLKGKKNPGTVGIPEAFFNVCVFPDGRVECVIVDQNNILRASCLKELNAITHFILVDDDDIPHPDSR